MAAALVSASVKFLCVRVAVFRSSTRPLFPALVFTAWAGVDGALLANRGLAAVGKQSTHQDLADGEGRRQARGGKKK